MIAISGALVFAAALLLVFGISLSHLALVYAAIGLAIVSAVFLLLGVFQRPAPSSTTKRADGADTESERPRKETAQSQEEPAEEIAPADGSAADSPIEATTADFKAQSAATGADVLVISGRPRYHLGGCEYVEGNDDAEPLEISEARELGFTPCGVCRPDETLAGGAAGSDQVDQVDG